MQLTFATYASDLSRWQTARVIQLIHAAHPRLACKEYVLQVSQDHHTSLDVGRKGVFPRDLEQAVLLGKADAAVHSLKDLPLEESPGILLAAIPERDAVFEVLVFAHDWTLSSLPEGARIGTSSLRRSAQLLARRPDLHVQPLYGGINTRLEKLLQGEYDGIVLSKAGLTRLGLQEYISEVVPLEVMLPAPGQGALAVQCRVLDTQTQELLAAIHDPTTAAAVYAERAFATRLRAECSLPLAAFAEKNNGTIILTGAVMSPDGRQAIRISAVDKDPDPLGRRLAELVLERGASEMFKATVP